MTTVSTADVGQTRLNQRELQYYCVTVNDLTYNSNNDFILCTQDEEEKKRPRPSFLTSAPHNLANGVKRKMPQTQQTESLITR